MALYRINLFSLYDELRAADPGLLYLFYADDAVFDSSSGRSAKLLNLLMKRGPEQGYFPELSKYFFISDTPGKEEGARRKFAA